MVWLCHNEMLTTKCVRNSLRSMRRVVMMAWTAVSGRRLNWVKLHITDLAVTELAEDTGVLRLVVSTISGASSNVTVMQLA